MVMVLQMFDFSRVFFTFLFKNKMDEKIVIKLSLYKLGGDWFLFSFFVLLFEPSQ